MTQEFTIGSDIEFVCMSSRGPISAERLITGTKWNPIVLESGNVFSHDNVLAEVATPVACHEQDFINKVEGAIRELKQMASPFKLLDAPCAVFPDEELNSMTAMEFGCDPDWNVWTETENPPPLATGIKYRSCGGHVHVGGVPEISSSGEARFKFARWMDVALGSVITSLFDGDLERQRRTLYGRSGCVRPTDYGIEYRALSNAWTGKPQHISLVYKLARDSIRATLSGLNPLWFVNQSDIEAAINNADRQASWDIARTLLASGIFNRDTEERIEECNA